MEKEITLEAIDTIRQRTGLSYREARELLVSHQGNIIDALIEWENQANKGWREEFTVRSDEIVDKVKELIHAGNVNKIRILHEGKVLMEIPVSIGAVSAVILPQLAALGVLVAVFKRCTIEVVRKEDDAEKAATKEEEVEGQPAENNEQPPRDVF